MYIRLIVSAFLLVGAWAASSSTTYAECVVEESVTTAEEGDHFRSDRCDSSKNKYITIGTLISGEDQPNNLLMMSGGVARGTEGNLINSAVGDATSASFALPTGYKTITGRITGAGAVAQVITIYGGTSSGMAAATSDVVGTITLSGTSGAAGTAYTLPPFIAPFLFYIAVTSGSSGTPTTILTASY